MLELAVAATSFAVAGCGVLVSLLAALGRARRAAPILLLAAIFLLLPWNMLFILYASLTRTRPPPLIEAAANTLLLAATALSATLLAAELTASKRERKNA